MEPVRALRAFYARPYFLPPMVEMSTRSLVAMATPIGDTSLGENHHKFLVRKFEFFTSKTQQQQQHKKHKKKEEKNIAIALFAYVIFCKRN